MRIRFAAACACVGVVLACTPALAHHSFSAEFDANNPIKLQGTVVKMDWVNPHAWIYLAVKKSDGTTEEWKIEGGTPNALFRRGFTKDSLKSGTEIVVSGYRAKDGSLKGNGRDITLPDGRKLFLGSSGTGAPTDGRDPSEK